MAPDAGIAYLTDLSVTSTNSHAVTLTPKFSPDIRDYFVRCTSATNEFEVTITAADGAEAQLTRPVTSPLRATQKVTVTPNEGDAIVAVVTEGLARGEYWVRCLPHEFPHLIWSRHEAAGSPPPGYYMIANATVLPGELAYAIVLDTNGVPVWYHAATPGALGFYDVDTLIPGTVSFSSANDSLPYSLIRLSPWSISEIGMFSEDDHHEMQVVSPDRYLVFHTETDAGVDLSGLSVPLADGGRLQLGKSETVNGCCIYEIDAAGQQYWVWQASDHLDPNKDTVDPEIVSETEAGVPTLGIYHCNSIDIDRATGNILLSTRNMDSVMYIDRKTSKILWKMGGSRYTRDGANYVPVPDAFHRQHDARLHSWKAGCGGATGTGQISMFDDETGEPGAVARGVLYDVTVGGNAGSCGDSTESKATLAWEYKGSVTSFIYGSFRLLKDGSHVIGWGTRTSQPLAFTEVDEEGHDLLDVTLDPGSANSTYRAIKVPISALDLGTLRNTAGE